MSCSNILWAMDYNCGGNIKRIQILDNNGCIVTDKTFRKWESYSINDLRFNLSEAVRFEQYEIAAEIRDEITLKSLGV